jgi:CBS domain containing-hemolysin-like protein
MHLTKRGEYGLRALIRLGIEHAADHHAISVSVLHIDRQASLTQLLTLFLEKSEIASLVDDASGQVTGWITMDDVMKVLMGARV